MTSSTDDTLVNKKCVPCHGGVSALTPAEAQQMLGRLLGPAGDDGWQLIEDGKALKREFKFADFYRAMSFVNAVAHIANAEDHHPDIECGWGYCRVRYQTHSIGGLHENDFICAAKIDLLPIGSEMQKKSSDAAEAAAFSDVGREPLTRWLALYVLCSGVLMIVLDTTIVNVALPSIREDLKFTETSLVWVVNAYMLTFGGFLLLGGRLGDLFGHRKLFLLGLIFFTLASLACGLAQTRLMLIAARALQGLGGAVVTAVALSLIMDLFTEAGERAKAMGIYGFVCSAGGSIGVLLGGFLTTTLNWHWIFLVNLPIGFAVYIASTRLLPRDAGRNAGPRVDVAGAITITTSLMLAVYAIVNGEILGWTSGTVLGLLGVAVLLLAAFLIIEARVRAPLMPLGLFRRRNIAVANVVAVLWAASMFAWFFISALYMQLVLGYNAMQVGLSFLPANLLMAAFSLGLSAKIVMRLGIRAPLAVGLALAALGLAMFARAPADGQFITDVLPGMVLLGLGCGIAFNPMLLGAMSDAGSQDSGLASGIVNTSFMMGGALGLAVLASIAAARTDALQESGATMVAALNGGYNRAFLWGALSGGAAALLGGVFMRTRT